MTYKKRLLTVAALALALSMGCRAQVSRVIDLPDWDFSRDGQSWHPVRIPHDWAISGPFDKKWDLSYERTRGERQWA